MGGKIRARGRENEVFFVTDISDPDDTPEDVDDDDEPEFCKSTNKSIDQSSCCLTMKLCSFTADHLNVIKI